MMPRMIIGGEGNDGTTQPEDGTGVKNAEPDLAMDTRNLDRRSAASGVYELS